MQVDNRHSPEPILTPEQAAAVCNRNFGIGGDGVSRLPPLPAASRLGWMPGRPPARPPPAGGRG
jgi:hypothetical protein